MNKYGKYILLTIGGVVIYQFLKAGSMSNKFSKFSEPVALKLLALQNALMRLGVKQPQLDFVLSQILHETGVFTSRSKVARENNNYTGIKWLNKSYQLATKGTRVPDSEFDFRNPERPTNFYAKFDSIDGWAKDFLRIVSLKRSGNNLGRPIEAITLPDYVSRLKANGFFGGEERVYQRATKKFFDMFVR